VSPSMTSSSPWLTEHPACPRCGLTLHSDDPAVGYYPESLGDRAGPMRLRHAHSTVTDRDGCIVALGRAMSMLNDRIAAMEVNRDAP
jgi:hypothetical protein